MLNKMKQHQDISTWDDRDLIQVHKRIEKLKDSLVAKDDTATSPISVMKPPFEDQKGLAGICSLSQYRKNAELMLNKMKQHQDISTWDDRVLI
ncbi:hypothetical protein E2320_002088 [Naja naja]|nr:hypothetical protein E2320_002088 [Naja naja]